MFHVLDLCCRVNSEGSSLLNWKIVLLGLKKPFMLKDMIISWHCSHYPFLVFSVCFLLGFHLLESQFPGDGVGLPTSESKHFTKSELIAQYIGRYLVLTKSQTDELFQSSLIITRD